MRKPLILAVIVLFCFSMLQFYHPISTFSRFMAESIIDNDSVIKNGGFENGLEYWATIGEGSVNVTDENVHGGHYSLETSSLVEQRAFFYQQVECPGTSYTFSFWIFRADPKSWTACYLDRDWDGNTARVVSSLVIQDDKIELNAWDDPYAPGRQVYDYDVAVGSWHNVTFAANSTLKTQDFYIDGSLIKSLNSSSGEAFAPDVLIFGDVSTDSCNGTFYFDDFQLGFQEVPNEFVLSIESNSTIAGMQFDAQNMTLSFTVSGEEGTTGYVRITLVKSLVADIEKLKIQVDSQDCNYTYQETSKSWIITFSYAHSTHLVFVDLSQSAVDEYSVIAFLFVVVCTGVALVLFRKNRLLTAYRPQ